MREDTTAATVLRVRRRHRHRRVRWQQFFYGTAARRQQGAFGARGIRAGRRELLRDGLGCRYLHRHEIGHALGFLGHRGNALMQSQSDVLLDCELRMIRALYSLPHGARRWELPVRVYLQ